MMGKYLFLIFFSSALALFGQAGHEDFVVEDAVLTAYTGTAQAVVIPNVLGITAIGERAFALSGVTSVTLSAGIERVGDWAFWGCDQLTEIRLPDGLVEIGDWAFLGCTALERIRLPARLTQIGDWAFGNCTSLAAFETAEENPAYTAIDGVLFDKTGVLLTVYPAGKPDSAYAIPEQGMLIRNLAFSGAGNLASVRLPAGLTYVGNLAFYGCSGLASIEADPENPEYRSIDGVLFDKTGTALLSYPPGRQSADYAVPEGTERIGDRAFYGNEGLHSVTLPEGLKRIGQEAFQECTALESVRLPQSVADVGDRAFYGCSGLNQIEVYRETRLGDAVFEAAPAEPAYAD